MYTWTLQHPSTVRGSIGTGALSFAFHAAIIGVAVYASLHPQAIVDAGRFIIDVQLSQPTAPPPPRGPAFAHAPAPFVALAIPATVPAFIPPPSQAAFDAASYSGLGDEVALPLGRDTTPRHAVSAETIYASEVLEERPVRIGGADPRYPDLLRNAGIGGRVRLEFILDSTGVVERGTARVLESTHELFSRAALDVVESWRFRPGRIDGRAVKVRVRMPVDFVKLSY